MGKAVVKEIEFGNGFKVKVSKRMLDGAGVKARDIKNSGLSPSELEVVKQALGDNRRRRAKYSEQFLKEAVKLSMRIGCHKAAKRFKMPYYTLRAARRDMVREGVVEGKRRPNNSHAKYTPLQKIQCVELALQLHNNHKDVTIKVHPMSTRLKYFGYTKKRQYNIVEAFKEAGRRLGVNGYSIWYQWTVGMLKTLLSPASLQLHLGRKFINYTRKPTSPFVE